VTKLDLPTDPILASPSDAVFEQVEEVRRGSHTSLDPGLRRS